MADIDYSQGARNAEPDWLEKAGHYGQLMCIAVGMMAPCYLVWRLLL